RVAEAEVHFGVGAAVAGGHEHGAAQLAEKLAPLGVDRPLAVHDVGGVRMAGHGLDISQIGPRAICCQRSAVSQRMKKDTGPNAAGSSLVARVLRRFVWLTADN